MKGDARVVARLRQTDKSDIGVPQPVVAEIAYGIERLPQSKRRETLLERLELVRGDLPRVAWDDQVSAHFGRAKAALERQGARIEDFDVAIAAHALAHGAILVTADVRDMARVPGLRVEDWGKPAS
jgi:tRNA(fMet)-specific endonuclease VapC